MAYLLMEGECNKREKNDTLLRCLVNKCFDGYQPVSDHSWKKKESMDLAKLHSPFKTPHFQNK
jgi:hypothetical protein